MSKLRHKKVELLTQSHTANKWWNFVNEIPNSGFKFHALYPCTILPLRFGASLSENQKKEKSLKICNSLKNLFLKYTIKNANIMQICYLFLLSFPS